MYPTLFYDFIFSGIICPAVRKCHSILEGILKTAGTVSFNHEVSFTCHGLGLVNWSCSEPDFDFVIGDAVFPVHAVLAEFLSAKIARIRRCDPLCYSYTFKNVDPDLLSALQSLVTSLQTGNPFHVNQSNYCTVFRLCQELEVNELLSSLLGVDPESVALEEAVSLLRASINTGSAYAKLFETLRDFVASRFHEINEDILADLDLDTAQLLLSSPSLKIKDEDSLYDFIKSRCEDDIKFASLFEFVYFEYLSQGSIETFARFVGENLIEKVLRTSTLSFGPRFVVASCSNRYSNKKINGLLQPKGHRRG